MFLYFCVSVICIMPCYADTIIKIIQARQSDKEETKLTVVWAVGVYPVVDEDCEMELVLFVPMDRHERDPNIQSIFRKDEYYSVGGKIIPGNYNGKLRLKVSVSVIFCIWY